MPVVPAQEAEAQKQADRQRDEFRARALLIVAPISAGVYCFLTGQWGAILGMLIIFGVVLFFAINFVGTYLASRSPLFAMMALTLATLIVGYSFSNTTEKKWEVRVGAVARDGWISSATGRGAASHHGGVDHWIMEPRSRALSDNERWVAVFGKFWYLLPIFGTSIALIAERCVYGRRKTGRACWLSTG